MNGGSGYDSSDSDSSSSSSSSGSSGSSLESQGVVWDTDEHGECISVSCANNKAKLYRNRFARGSVGESVLFEGQWMTVNQFQTVSGRERQSVHGSNGLSLKQCVNEHKKTCQCSLCCKNSHADGSSNEDEYCPRKPTDSDHPHSVIDISDFIPRRSRRGHKQFKGHRTMLGTYPRQPIHWDSEEVAEFLRCHGFSQYATPFLQCGIDGQSLFLLKEHHLFERFHMKLGPALCLLDTVDRLRHPPAH